MDGKPVALDLFCGAGGVAKGLQRAGFYVVGVDIKPQPRYVGDLFVQGDALNPPFDLSRFDFVWASPKCQAHTTLRTMWNARTHADQIEPTRALMRQTNRPWVIENVAGAPLRSPAMLCGTMFGLRTPCGADLRRHRFFEANFDFGLTPTCQHGSRTVGIYGEAVRDATGDNRRRGARTYKHYTVHDARAAMDTPWMTLAELCEAIPPAYAEFIGRAAMAAIADRSLAA